MNSSGLGRRAVRAGLVGGVVVIYLALVGMVEKFDVRYLIGGVLTLGKLLLALPPLLAGYFAARPVLERGRLQHAAPPAAVSAGLASGLLTGAVTAAGVALASAFAPTTVRDIFVAVSPTLLSIVTFGKDLPVAAFVLLLGGAALGGLGAAYRVLPRPYRRPLAVGLVVVLLVGLLQRIVPTMLFELGLDTTWLYSTTTGGLTGLGAVVVWLLAAGASLSWSLRGEVARRQLQRLPAARRRALRWLGALLLVAALLALPRLVGSVLSEVLGTVGIFLLMGLGLNIVVGYAGLLDLGYVAFFAAGAYLTALFTGAQMVTSLGATTSPAFVLHFDFYAAMPLVIAAAAFIGLLIGAPVLRLRGDYLAIVTLGFGEIVRVLVTSDWLRGFLGAAQGLRDVTDASIGGLGFRDPQPFYYLVLAFCVVAIYVSQRLASSRIGRAWNAMREDELAAESMGVSTMRYKLLAFAMGAGMGCLSGALFAVKIGSLTPVSFNILVSITALAVIILGGMGSIRGVIVGALVLIGIPGFLDEFEEYKLLIYGAVLTAIMILRPQGLLPNVRRMRELHEEEVAQDQWLKEEAGQGAAPVTVSGGEDSA